MIGHISLKSGKTGQLLSGKKCARDTTIRG
jgi:hypothetical protein